MSRSTKFLLLTFGLFVALGGTGFMAVTFLAGDDSGARGRGTSHGPKDERTLEFDAADLERDRTSERDRTKDAVAKKTTWRVTGFVTSVDGAPIPGALVRATEIDMGSWRGKKQTLSRTDRDGAFELVLTTSPQCAFDVAADHFLPLIGTHDGGSNETQDLFCEGAGPWSKNFQLTPAANLVGRVTDEAGNPVRDATVYVISAKHYLVESYHFGNTARTDPAGRFSFPGVNAGPTDLGVRADGFLPGMRRDLEVPAVGQLTADLTVRRGRTVRVSVTGADDAPDEFEVLALDPWLRNPKGPPIHGRVDAFAGALVGRSFIDYPVVSVQGAAKDGEARVEVTGLPPGPMDFSVRQQGKLTEPGIGSRRDVKGSEVALELLPFTWVTLEAFDAATGEEINPFVTRVSDGEPMIPRRAVEDPINPGMISIPVDARRHELIFQLDGYAEHKEVLPDLSGASVEVLGPAAHRVSVRMQPLTDEATGGFRLKLDPAFRGNVAVIGKDAEGNRKWVRHLAGGDTKRWLVEGVPVGTYYVTVLATGKVPKELPVMTITSSHLPTHEITLTDGGGIDLKIEGPDGKLLEKVHILLQDASGRQIDVQIFTEVSSGRAFVSVNYLPTIAAAKSDSGLAPGSYTLRAGKEGYAPAETSFSIAGTEVASVTLRLARR